MYQNLSPFGRIFKILEPVKALSLSAEPKNEEIAKKLFFPTSVKITLKIAHFESFSW